MVSKSGYFLSIAILIRLLLVICGSGVHLQQRMEVMSTNDDPRTAAETRFLLFPSPDNLSAIPPLQTPPLLLLLIPTDNLLIRGLINIVVDIFAALSLFTTSQSLFSPATVAAFFLCNPLTIASCISGSAATLTLGLTIIAIHLSSSSSSSSLSLLGAVILGLACHLSPTSFSLLPAILLLLYNNMRRDQQPKAPTPSFITTALFYFSAMLLTTYLSVVIPSSVLSSSSSQDTSTRHNSNKIKEGILMWGQNKLLASLPPPLRTGLLPSSPSSSIVKIVNVAAGTITTPPPNLGLQWYLLVEVFPMYKPLFEYVIRMLPAALAIPIALRFTDSVINKKKKASRPIISSCSNTTTNIQLSYIILCVQAAINAMLNHHPTYGSIALWMAFFPLTGVMNNDINNSIGKRVVWVWLGVGMPICLALCTATHNIWLVTGMANVNFFYGMTLVWALWQVAFIIQLLKAGVEMEVGENLGYKKAEKKTL
jgi:hypothetical protein